MWIAQAVVGWLVCAAAAYLLLRHALRGAMSWSWTVGERRLGLILSLLLPPIALIAALIIMVLELLLSLGDGDKEAHW